MKQMTLSEYLAIQKDSRSVWDTERTDWPDWENIRERYMGKRTYMTWVEGRGTCLLVEGQDFEIIDEPKEQPKLIDTGKRLTMAEIKALPYNTPVRIKDVVECHPMYKTSGKLVHTTREQTVDDKGVAIYTFGISVDEGTCYEFAPEDYEVL